MAIARSTPAQKPSTGEDESSECPPKMPMILTSKADRLAGERMVEVEDGRGFVEFAQEDLAPLTHPAPTPSGAEFDQRIHLEFRSRSAATPAGDTLDEARVVLAEGIVRLRVRRRNARRHEPSRQASSDAASRPPPICRVAGDMSKVTDMLSAISAEMVVEASGNCPERTVAFVHCICSCGSVGPRQR